jgi:hypothetical protein
MQAQPMTASTRHGQAVISRFYRLLEEAAARDEEGAALLEKFRTQGFLLNRAVARIEERIEGVHTVRQQGRSQREHDVAVFRWAGSLLSALIPWASSDGPEQVKKLTAIKRRVEDRNQDIAATARKLLKLVQRNADAVMNEMRPGVPYNPLDVQLPHLQRDLHRLIHLAKGKRREYLKTRRAEIRSNNGLPSPAQKKSLAHGAQGFISVVDRALPFPMPSNAVIDLWRFVSGKDIDGNTVRVARDPKRNRTNPG